MLVSKLSWSPFFYPSADNGNDNGNCKGNCFHNMAGNGNGNSNTITTEGKKRFYFTVINKCPAIINIKNDKVPT